VMVGVTGQNETMGERFGIVRVHKVHSSWRKLRR